MSTTKIFKIKQLVNSDICPLGRSNIMTLINYGELKKLGILPEGQNHIIGMKMGVGTSNMYWGVSLDEIQAWQERCKILSPNEKLPG